MDKTRLAIASVITALICVYLAQPPVGRLKIYDSRWDSFTVDDTQANRAEVLKQGYTIGTMDWSAGYLALAFGASLPALWILGWALLRQTSRETSRVIRQC